MELWTITWVNGKTLVEYGDSPEDVRAFIRRSYAHYGAVKSIEPYMVD